MTAVRAETMWIHPEVFTGDPFPWVACEHPERPPDTGLGYHVAWAENGPCRPCGISYRASVANGTMPWDDLLAEIILGDEAVAS